MTMKRLMNSWITAGMRFRGDVAKALILVDLRDKFDGDFDARI